ncbi:hypothetical protein GCM10027578_08300 [Spirosoma luteolum]
MPIYALSSPACICIAGGLLAGLLSCSSATDASRDPLLIEAAQFHQQATAIQALVEPRIEQIDSIRQVLQARQTPAAVARIATLDSLKQAFESWEENLVEVPGMPHNHTHEADPGRQTHHHHHADATLKDLPAGHMRDLQREMLNNIRQIQARLDAVTKAD